MAINNMAEIMQKKAEGPLRDIYPVIAREILDNFGFSEGICVDIGGGPGQLCEAMSEISDFQLFNLDISQDMLAFAQKNFSDHGLEKRIKNIHSNAEKIPLKSESIDLIMSRGSSFAWDNPLKAFSEIFRILKKGGKAYIGIGCIFGTEELRQRIVTNFIKEEPNWKKGSIERESKFTFTDAEEICKQLEIKNYTKLKKGADKWFIISR